MLRRTIAVAGALAVCLTVSGCGSGARPASAPGGADRPISTTGSTVPSDEFCNNLDDLNSTAQQVGLDRRLAAVRADLDRSAAKASQVLADGVPASPGVEPFLGRLASDLRNISRWVDNGATQADLDADTVPSAVRKSMDDMGYDFRQLQQWAAANCKDQQQGDGQ